jgi:predicted DNA-binding protein (MmcQ/YjbR family)
MNVENLRQCCLAVKGATESMPFDADTLVYKVMDKVFAFFSLAPKDGKFWLVLKCNPDRSIDLMERYSGITKGFYAGDTPSWNTVFVESDVPDKLIEELIAHSVSEVVAKLPKYKREQYLALQ